MFLYRANCFHGAVGAETYGVTRSVKAFPGAWACFARRLGQVPAITICTPWDTGEMKLNSRFSCLLLLLNKC